MKKTLIVFIAMYHESLAKRLALRTLNAIEIKLMLELIYKSLN
jgi:hypothetical protein